jgi:hypothetical protein
VGKPGAASGIEIETNGPIYPKHNCKTFQSIDKRFSSEWKKYFEELYGGINLKKSTSKPWKANCTKPVAGEIVNIDAITGGFNFQNAWTSGFILVFGEQ